VRIELRELEAALGHLLCHNIADAAGRRVLVKGRALRPADLATLADLGCTQVRVAVLDPGDVHEDNAAAAVAALTAGDGLSAGPPQVGRVNLQAVQSGTLYVQAAALQTINEIDGITVATLPAYSYVQPGAVAATIKIIPFAVPAGALEAVRAAVAGPVLAVRPPQVVRCGVLLIAAERAWARVEHAVWPAVERRLAPLTAELPLRAAAEPDEAAVAVALTALLDHSAGLILVAGETSVVDADDVLPRALRRLGGRVAVYGAPVEPGNLLLLGYLGTTAVIGAPGCIRSRERNVVDLILPRLIAGEVLRQSDIAALGVGGLLGRH
jgi:molybdenum cofactor cytidylyltransferase